MIHDETGEVLATFEGPTPDAYAKAKAIGMGITTAWVVTVARLAASSAEVPEDPSPRVCGSHTSGR